MIVKVVEFVLTTGAISLGSQLSAGPGHPPQILSGSLLSLTIYPEAPVIALQDKSTEVPDAEQEGVGFVVQGRQVIVIGSFQSCCPNKYLLPEAPIFTVRD